MKKPGQKNCPGFLNAQHTLLRILLHQSGDVFPDDVELDVYDGSDPEGVEIRMLVGIRDDRHLEGIVAGVDHGQAHAVHGNRPFLVRDVPGRRVVGEREVSVSFGFFDRGTDRRLVYVPLHDVSVQQGVRLHAALEVDFIADREQAQVGFEQRLLDCRNRIGILLQTDNRQADPVVGNALVDFKFADERAG